MSPLSSIHNYTTGVNEHILTNAMEDIFISSNDKCESLVSISSQDETVEREVDNDNKETQRQKQQQITDNITTLANNWCDKGQDIANKKSNWGGALTIWNRAPCLQRRSIIGE